MAGSSLAVDYGVYDPSYSFDKVKLTYEHIWYRWNDPLFYAKYGTLPVQLKSIVAKGRTPIITIEPWQVDSIGTKDGLLLDITAGKYDAVTTTIAEEINAVGVTVLVRWGHEMECVPTYPWSQRFIADYISAFRRVAGIFKKIAPKVLMVWSPVGNPDCELYYPGSDVVDYIGFTIFEFPEVSIGWFGHDERFSGWMDQKYPRFVKFDKPIIVAELGVYSNAAKQKEWMEDVFATAEQYPLLKALIYFNTLDIATWKKWGGIEAPNWTIDPTVFQNLNPQNVANK